MNDAVPPPPDRSGGDALAGSPETPGGSGEPGGPPHDAPPPGSDGERVERPGLDGRERQLDPAAVTSWRISAAFALLPPLTIITVLAFVFGGRWAWAVLTGAVVLLAFVVGWLQRARYRRWRWQLTELAVELRYGVLVHQQETVPYFRIQQIDIAQGPLDRLLSLATLQVTTASASGSATLPGITADEAPEVRAELLARATEAVAEHPGDLRDAV